MTFVLLVLSFPERTKCRKARLTHTILCCFCFSNQHKRLRNIRTSNYMFSLNWSNTFRYINLSLLTILHLSCSGKDSIRDYIGFPNFKSSKSVKNKQVKIKKTDCFCTCNSSQCVPTGAGFCVRSITLLLKP